MRDLELLVKSDLSFRYQMLGRLISDVKYYLGAGNGAAKHLWAGDVRSQIEAMLAIYDSFEEDELPDWITFAQIQEYKEWMLNYRRELTRAMTTKAFFHMIDNRLEYDREKITVVDDNARVVRLENDCFSIKFSVKPSFSEEKPGYFLTLYVSGDYGEIGNTAIGMYNIPEVTPDEIKKLANLGVDFMATAEDYVQKNKEDFQWKGFRVLYMESREGKNNATLGFSENKGVAVRMASDFRKEHESWKGLVTVVDLSTRREVASY